MSLPLAAPGLMASAIFVFLISLDEFSGTFFVGVPDVRTLPLTMLNAALEGNYQIKSTNKNLFKFYTITLSHILLACLHRHI